MTAPEFILEWNGEDTPNRTFENSSNLTIDSTGRIYICVGYIHHYLYSDILERSVFIFDSTGSFLSAIYVDYKNTFIAPMPYFGVAYSTTTNSTYCTNSVTYIGSELDGVIQYGGSNAHWGIYGSGDGQFIQPRGIAVDSLGNVYVSDSTNRIQKFTSAGAFLLKWGSSGAGDGQFSGIYSIISDSSNNIYVSDQSNNRIQKFTSTGTFLTKWGSWGTGDGQFKYPAGIAVDFYGNIYVSDQYNDRIQVFTSNGTFITKWGSTGSGDGQFSYPAGITIDSQGYIYVADAGNLRIQKFGSATIVGSKVAIVTDINGKSFILPLSTVTVGDKVALLYDSSGKQFCKKL